MGKDGMGRDGARRDGTGGDGTGRNGTGGTERDGTGRDGTGREIMIALFLLLVYLYLYLYSRFDNVHRPSFEHNRQHTTQVEAVQLEKKLRSCGNRHGYIADASPAIW